MGSKQFQDVRADSGFTHTAELLLGCPTSSLKSSNRTDSIVLSLLLTFRSTQISDHLHKYLRFRWSSEILLFVNPLTSVIIEDNPKFLADRKINIENNTMNQFGKEICEIPTGTWPYQPRKLKACHLTFISHKLCQQYKT